MSHAIEINDLVTLKYSDFLCQCLFAGDIAHSTPLAAMLCINSWIYRFFATQSSTLKLSHYADLHTLLMWKDFLSANGKNWKEKYLFKRIIAASF
jgi:hypothetical protein